ncbi:cell division protein FtsA [Candidatus Saccharibacteria bacterium]|nr:cell division protein FtsA [Candidatus Saccharibacteria bacterium]
MAKKKQDLLVGLDIGTTEVRCLVGVRPTEDDKKFHVLGLGYATNEGMRGGVIVNYDEVVGAVDTAIRQAELNSGHKIEAVTVNVNGGHLRSEACRAEVAVSNADRVVTDFERDLVDAKARELNVPPNREVIQFFANSYRVDQVKDLEDPVGIHGNVVGIKALAITGLTAHVETLERVCAEVGIKINNKTVSSLAAYEATFSKKASESGVAVVDIGHSTTNVLVVKEGKVEHAAVIPLGGFNVTKDIAIILQVDLDVAEFLKVNYADVNYDGRGTKTVEFNRQSINFSPKSLGEVTEARLREICELIEDMLQEAGYSQQLPGGIILTGGGSQTKGLKDLFQDQLGIYTRLGKVRNFGGLVETIEQKREYLTVAGILALDFTLQIDKLSNSPLRSGWLQGLSLFNLFRGKVRDKGEGLKQKLDQKLEQPAGKQKEAAKKSDD